MKKIPNPKFNTKHSYSFYKLQTAKYRLSRGITFIEMTIVISIFSILAGTLLLNFSRFSRNISIQNLAQDIALQINSAQKDAISGLISPLIWDCERAAINTDCAPRYGVYFVPVGGVDSKFTNTAPSGVAVAGSSIIRFFDHTDSILSDIPDGQYNHTNSVNCGDVGNGSASSLLECLDVLNLGQGNLISSICGVPINSFNGDLTCDINQSLENVSISFKRPFPDAIIKDDGNNDYAFVRITITSPNIDTQPRDIVVTKLGRISIERVP